MTNHKNRHPGGVSIKSQRTLAGICRDEGGGGNGRNGGEVWPTVGESSCGDVPAEVMVLEVVAARGGVWYGGSYRSEEREHFWGSPEKSPETTAGSDDGGRRKQAHASHKAKNIVSMTRCLELLHIDLFDPSAVQSYGGNNCTLVIVDDYSRKVKDSLNVTFNETPPPSKTSLLVDDDLDEEEEEAIKVTEKKNLENDIEDETLKIDEIININESGNHPLENIIGNLNQRTL
uniref:Retrovirus-related Pol polyprotein from transposon TNT 1-94 n=1 Tax=Tanacetum cinerariifolium TaxID=118510 RepID=A0A6L2M4U2_TANCI|nr:retrovirus-related Pol polyprotein from transposon TNT 1-94 [Tanacetum cinerariifolium]